MSPAKLAAENERLTRELEHSKKHNEYLMRDYGAGVWYGRMYQVWQQECDALRIRVGYLEGKLRDAKKPRKP